MRPPAATPREARKLGFERFLYFSDAVFAIAITLLVLDLRAPAGAAFALTPMIPKIAGFAVSFYVIGQYWMAHHELFERIEGYDARLLGVNLWFLAGIVFLPFATSVVVGAPPDTAPVAFYALSLAFAGGSMMMLVLAARREGLMRPGETRGGTLRVVIRSAGPTLVFLATAAIATVQPRLALWTLLLLIPVGRASDRIGRAIERRIDQAPA